MRRPQWPLMLIVCLVAVAFMIRFNRLNQAHRSTTTDDNVPSTQPTATWTLPNEPDDYVARPLIDPSEAIHGPARIISMAPSVTELCAAMGLADRLVGRTQFCQYPPSTQHAEVVGGYSDPSLERILALKPDLILITTSSAQLREKFAALDLPVKELPDSSIDDIFKAINRIGQYTDRPITAQRLAEHLEEDIVQLSQTCQAAGYHPQRVLVVTGSLPATPGSVYVAGPGAYLDELLTNAGHTNALAGLIDRPWAQISMETLLAASPDAILEFRGETDPANMNALQQAWAQFDQVPAIKNWRLCTISDDSVLIPGPRININMYKIIKALSVSKP